MCLENPLEVRCNDLTKNVEKLINAFGGFSGRDPFLSDNIGGRIPTGKKA